jgi:predicted cupin superfamily sugar epimerase
VVIAFDSLWTVRKRDQDHCAIFKFHSQIQSLVRTRLLRYFLRMTNRPYDARYWIEKLQLNPHPEGGYYRETYRSEDVLAREALPSRFEGARAASTAIYFLIEGENFSAFHRLVSDEMWHFYAGSALLVHAVNSIGAYSSLRLGNDAEAGEVPQAVVPAGYWFASHVADWKSWALVGCTVSPGFDFADFEIGSRTKLTELYPQHRELILRLTRS